MITGNGIVSPVKRREDSGLTAGQRAWARSHKSPRWKERFQEQCLERLQSLREQVQRNNRSPIKVNSMQNVRFEMSDMNSEPSPVSRVLFSTNNNSSGENINLELSLMNQFIQQALEEFKEGEEFSDEKIDYLLSMEERDELSSILNNALYHDLEDEEQRMVSEYLSAEYEAFKYQAFEVVCPVCKMHNLMINDRVIFCPCGIRVDTQSDAVDLRYAHDSINETIEQHASHCHGIPFFYVEEQWYVCLLFLGCNECGAKEVAL